MNDFTSLLRGKDALPVAQSVDRLLQTNDTSQKYGLRLSARDALELVQNRDEVLQGYGRIEFGDGILDRIAFAFCDSPYAEPDTYAELLAVVTELFYRTKGESMERMPDDLILDRLKEAFNGACEGSLEKLAVVMDTIAFNIRNYGCETAPEEDEQRNCACGHPHTEAYEEEEEDDASFYGEEDGNWRTVRF